MKKLLCLFLILFCVSSCSFLSPRKRDIEQGNIISQEQVNMLHKGLSLQEVTRIMGDPIMKNIFTKNQVVYVYTIQKGGEVRHEKRVECTFYHGHLVSVNFRSNEG